MARLFCIESMHGQLYAVPYLEGAVHLQMNFSANKLPLSPEGCHLTSRGIKVICSGPLIYIINEQLFKLNMEK